MANCQTIKTKLFKIMHNKQKHERAKKQKKVKQKGGRRKRK